MRSAKKREGGSGSNGGGDGKKFADSKVASLEKKIKNQRRHMAALNSKSRCVVFEDDESDSSSDESEDEDGNGTSNRKHRDLTRLP